MTIKIYQVDAFREEGFLGNPAKVVLTATPLSEVEMQFIAYEMNLSETAFLYPLTASVYNLRWFTPLVEVPLCGHATLAAAAVLKEFYGEERVLFKSGAREISSWFADEKIHLEFPYPRKHRRELRKEVFSLFEEKPLNGGFFSEDNHFFVELPTERAVLDFKPDFFAMSSAGNFSTLSIMARSACYDYIVRCFAPWEGINEDPVTGSANLALSGYWHELLNKDKFKIYQASQRGGILSIDFSQSLPVIAGKYKIISEGVLLRSCFENIGN